MESIKWKCGLCLENGDESIATNWCKKCNKFFCAKCNKFHQKFRKEDQVIKLAGISQEEIKEVMRADMCKIHSKVEGSYCKTCNRCLCKTCHIRHLEDSRDCGSHPMSESGETLKKQKVDGSTLLEKIKKLENNLEERKEKLRTYIVEFENQSDLKHKELSQNSENICEKFRSITQKQVEKWRKFQDETERMLKKLKIWYIYLSDLLQKENVDFWVKWVERELVSLSLSPEFNQNISEPARELQLRMKFFPDLRQFIQDLKNIRLEPLDYSNDLILFEKEWILPKSKERRFIQSLVISNNHIFLVDRGNNSIIELKESGELVDELSLTREGKIYSPREIFISSPEILGVICLQKRDNRENLIFLERKNNSSLKIKKIIDIKITSNSFISSVCQIKDRILICQSDKLQITFCTINGYHLNTINTDKSGKYPSRIRADPSTGKFWGTIQNTKDLFYFNEYAKILETFETEEIISDFSANEFGGIYCNLEGIFAFFLETKSCKELYKFDKKPGARPTIFVSKEKLVVCLKINNEYLIRIFKNLT